MELTRTSPATPQNIPITDITSDENGREAIGSSGEPSSRDHPLNHEVVVLTQKALDIRVRDIGTGQLRNGSRNPRA